MRRFAARAIDLKNGERVTTHERINMAEFHIESPVVKTGEIVKYRIQFFD
ncbi:Uncharacterised protein [Vibrio cholerae]|nr:Uncharacterised protein [Vibrio cholerae]CSC84928.1 Uncharacterised protein [Vibrio cholerae]